MRYMNIPGLDKPMQTLKVVIRRRLRAGRVAAARESARSPAASVRRAGVRQHRRIPNPNADALTFRDEDGSPVQYSSGKLPDPKILWSPRVGFNWDVAGDQRTQVRGGTGVFTGPPLYVWISNQLGNTGVLQGSLARGQHRRPAVQSRLRIATGRPTSPARRRASYELNVTDNDFKFPQVWRTNIAVDRRLPWRRHRHGGVHLQQRRQRHLLHQRQPAGGAVGVHRRRHRPRWIGPRAAPTAGPCVTRINNAAGNQVTGAIVMKNQSVGQLVERLRHAVEVAVPRAVAQGRLQLRRRAEHDRSGLDRRLVVASSTSTPAIRTTPASGARAGSGTPRVLQTSYSRSYFGFGATTISAFWEAKPRSTAPARLSTNASYVFAGDMNGDGGSGNDLIYIPRNTSEMNFVDVHGPERRDVHRRRSRPRRSRPTSTRTST